MKIDGRAIADQILKNLRPQVATLKHHGISPTLAVIQVGDDPGSTAYIRQKQKSAEQIGANLIIRNQESGIRNQELKAIINQYNHDPSVHGIIVQRPLPEHLYAENILPSKDVDGFLPDSPYHVPVALAVQKILEEVFPDSSFLIHNSIVVLGRGETAGKPIAEALIKKGSRVTIVHSHTPNPDDVIRAADIIISCVGKPNVVRRDNIKKDAILVSVGLSRDSEGKLHGDYQEDQIMGLASCYTPTPGGVGPVNVACLMANLVEAASKLL